MANRYCTVDELTETEALIAEAIRVIKDLLKEQQQEIKQISEAIRELRVEIEVLSGGQE